MSPGELRLAAARLDAGITLGSTAELGDGTVADILSLARDTGASRSRLLRVVADAMEVNDGLTREAQIAATAARQSAVVLSFLPALTLVSAELFGVHALGFLLGGPAGWVCFALGISSSAAGWRWMERLRTNIEPPRPTTGVLIDVVAEVLTVTGIRAEFDDTMYRMATEWNCADEWADIQHTRRGARDTGTPVVGLLRAAAEERRRVARFATREAIERLPGRMLIPLGVCLFPAFVFLTVIPAIAGMAQGFFRSTG